MSDAAIGLYVHIPWCVRKCPYCDFNSHAAAVGESLPERAYIDALLADLTFDIERFGSRTIGSIFIGGGTPSLFAPSAIERLLQGIAANLTIVDEPEITLEANPGTVDVDRFSGFRSAGVNRLSIGIQSFADHKLKALGRIHGRDEALRAADSARRAGFENFNLDLMFGLPEQSIEQAVADIDTAIAQEPSHISFYQLTLEPNTLFHHQPPPLPLDETIWSMQQACQQRLADGGYQQYEVSAYARKGRQCRHNRNYWCFGDYYGIGAGAHGKLRDSETGAFRRYWKQRHPSAYLDTAGTDRGFGGIDPIQSDDLPVEFLMNHLRLREGFPITSLRRQTGLSIEALQPGLSQCLRRGWLERRDGRIRCTETGWNFLDDVLQAFISAG